MPCLASWPALWRLMLFCASLFLLTATPGRAAPAISFAKEAPAGGTIILPLSGPADLDRHQDLLGSDLRSAIERALQSADFDYKPESRLALRGLGDRDQILILGFGTEPPAARAMADLGGTAAQATRGGKAPVALILNGLEDMGAQALAEVALGIEIGGYGFGHYKSGGGADNASAMVLVSAEADAIARAYDAGLRATAAAVTFARDLVSEPANMLWPEAFVERSRAAFKGVRGVRVEVLDESDMEKRGMGALLAVGQGSARPPRLLVVQYRGRGAPAQTIALVGKGITFDSGGVSLKPGKGMWRMKGDMAGAAAVMGAVLSVARQELPLNVVAIAALAENMPDGGALRPGDVVRAINGKTIEILNTDAEGRLVLADAVAYAQERFDPAVIVDVATLTGSVVAALGNEYAGLFSRHDGLAEQLLAAGRTTGEELWRLPLHPSYGDDLNSAIADIKNVAEGTHPGAGLGAHFIGFFVAPDTPWAHLDIAGMGWSLEDAPTVPRGATGYPVRLLDRFLSDYKPVIRTPAPDDR